MQLELTQETAEAVRSKVESGLYPDADAVIVAALRLLDDQEEHRRQKLASLRRDVQAGLDDMANGRYATHDRASFAELIDTIEKDGLWEGASAWVPRALTALGEH